jgi:Tfp pilus assembly protein PilF
MIYPRWVVDPAKLSTWIPAVSVVLAFAGLALAARATGEMPRQSGRAEPSAASSALHLLAAFVLALVPVLGLVDLAWFRFAFVADHWAYLALPWALALVADLGARALSAAPVRASAPAAAVILVAATTALGASRARVFRDQGALWPDVIAKNPGSWIAHNSYGRWLAGGNRRAEARAMFEEASRLRPDYSYPVYNLALMNLEDGDDEGAKVLLRRALEIAPNYPDAHATLGGILVSQGRLEEGIGHLETSLKLEEKNASGWLSLGIAQLAQGDAASGAASMRRAKSLDPTNANAPYHLARALVQLGDVEAAAVEMREVLRLVPDHPDAAAVLAALEQAIAARSGRSSPGAGAEAGESAAPSAPAPGDSAR